MKALSGGSPEQDRADYQRAQQARQEQSGRASGLGWDGPPDGGASEAPASQEPVGN